MSKGFNVMANNKVNEFKSVIELYGFSKDYFELVEIRESTDSEEIKMINGEIKVLRKSLNIERVYDVDDKSMWTTEFEDDLKHGAFGQV